MVQKLGETCEIKLLSFSVINSVRYLKSFMVVLVALKYLNFKKHPPTPHTILWTVKTYGAASFFLYALCIYHPFKLKIQSKAGLLRPKVFPKTSKQLQNNFQKFRKRQF